MDYEFKIRVLERELAHVREMQELMRSHVDAHDRSLEAAVHRFERIETVLEKLATAQLTTQETLNKVIDKLNGLIDAIVANQRNGHESSR